MSSNQRLLNSFVFGAFVTALGQALVSLLLHTPIRALRATDVLAMFLLALFWYRLSERSARRKLEKQWLESQNKDDKGE